MLKRIWTLMRMDMTGSLRDSMIIYSVIAPVLLAFVIRLLVPSVQNLTLSIAVDAGIPEAVQSRLSDYCTVRVYASPGEVIKRVNENDDIIGLYMEDNMYTIVVEGNEGEETGEGIAAFLADVHIDFRTAGFDVRDLKQEPAPVLEYGAAMMFLLSMLIGGILIGFSIVDEKESGAIRALAVSPLRIVDVILARSCIAITLGIITGLSSCIIILGWNIDYVKFFISVLSCLAVAVPFGFIIGAFADNQMKAFALVKLLMGFYTAVPFISIFVPTGWHWVFYLFPNYWMFMTIRNVLVGTAHIGFVLSSILTTGSGLIMVSILFPKLRAGLNLR